MSKRKTYSIHVLNRFWMPKLLNELREWGVSTSRYQVDDMTITTKDPNVVDVATETFFSKPELIEIKVER